MLELYHWEPNGSALKTLICLHEKGLDYTSHYVDLLAFEQYAPAFLELNPEGLVPVLRHGGKVLTESQFINEYLDEVFPETALRPIGAAELWRMRVWGKFTGEVVAPAVSTLGCHAWLSPVLQGRDITPVLERMPLPERRAGWRMAAEDDYGVLLEDSRRMVGDAARQMENRLQDHGWLAGESYSLADIELFAWFHALEELAPDVVNGGQTPRLLDWLNRIRSRAAVAAALATGRAGAPDHAFAPGPEHSRWG